MLCWVQRPSEGKALILHAASSTTNTVKYCDLFESTVLPYWQSDPPRHRLTSKPYKSIWAKNSYLPEDSLTFKVRGHSTLVPLQGSSYRAPPRIDLLLKGPLMPLLTRASCGNA